MKETKFVVVDPADCVENPDGSIDTENLIKEISQIFGNPPTAQALRLGIDATDFLEMQKNILQSQNVI